MDYRTEAIRKSKWNKYKRKYYAKTKAMTPTERFEMKQRVLWHRLRSIFDHKEYISYASLPKALQEQIEPFEGEIMYPDSFRV